MKIKIRYIAATLAVLASIAATPWAVAHAYEFRGGQMAFGGEWLIIPFGFILAYIALEIGKWWDGVMERRQARRRWLKLQQRKVLPCRYIRFDSLPPGAIIMERKPEGGGSDE